MRPRDKVIELLRTLDEVRQTYNSGSGGGGVTMMPSDYSLHSYPELERCLVEMRETHRQQRWHLMQRYVWGDPENWVKVPSRKTRQGRIPILPQRSELLITGEVLERGIMWVKLYTWAEAVDPDLVSAGVDLLTSKMYCGQWWRLSLPKPILEGMTTDVEPWSGFVPSTALTTA